MKKFVLLIGASLLLASTAHADGFYAGGSLGFGDATLRSDGQFDDPDDNLLVIKGFGGYRVNEFFAVEGSIIGATNDEYDDGFDGEADVSFGALTGSLLGIIPVDESFELYAKIGGYTGESEVQDEIIFFDFNDRSRDESGLVWGAGTFFKLGSRKQFTIRVDYEAFDTDALDDLWLVTAGFQFNF